MRLRVRGGEQTRAGAGSVVRDNNDSDTRDSGAAHVGVLVLARLKTQESTCGPEWAAAGK